MIKVESKTLKLNKEDMMKVLKGAGIAAGGAVLTYATEMIPMIEWGEYKPMIVALGAVLVNFGWKLLKGKK